MQNSRCKAESCFPRKNRPYFVTKHPPCLGGRESNSELFCTLANSLKFQLILALRSTTSDQDNVYSENVCIEQYAHFGFNAVSTLKYFK